MKPENKTVAFYTLGCKLNFTETASMSRSFVEKGYTKVDFDEAADFYIINTCSVTQTADKKCRQAINKAVRKGGKVIVTGCYAQLHPEDIKSMEGVEMVVGTRDKMQLPEYLDDFYGGKFSAIHTCNIDSVEIFTPAFSLNERSRSFLKIQDGCDYHCSYCTVPLARGKSRNSPVKEVIEQTKLIAKNGLKEIILTGVNIGDFGKSTGESFYSLLKELIKVDGIERYRISSIEPNLLTTEIIELVASSSRLSHHFHIPLQSGNNKILALMKRRYNRELYAEKINLIRQIIPYASIGSDVIIGFPGETEKDFNETYDFLKDKDISYLHVFPYSERKNTPAATMNAKVNPKEKEQRSGRLIELSEQKTDAFYKKNEGRLESVLFESNIKDNKATGFTSNYISVELSSNVAVINTLLNVKLKSRNERGNMEAEILNN